MKDKNLKKPFVSLVGAGPGDMGLVTDKAFDCIKKADVIIYDNLIPLSLLNMAKLSAKLIYAGKKSSNHHLTQAEINNLLVNEAKKENYVVRLKGGDPFVFGRGGEEIEILKKHNIEYEVVSGISSCISVASGAGIPITHRKVASSFHVITGHEDISKKESDIDYESLAKLNGTLCFLMGLNNIELISQKLIENGKDKNTPTAVISNGNMINQKRIDGTLENIAKKVKEQNITSPAIIVVGEVTRFHFDSYIDNIKKKPLYGKKIFITGTREIAKRLAPLIKEAGGEAICLSLIETVLNDDKYYKKDIENIDSYTWLLFTSSNGIRTFFEYIQNKGDLIIDRRKLATLKFAVIGTGSALTLKDYGYIADFIPTKFSGKGLADEWVPTLKKDDRVLILRSKEAGDDVIKALDKAGISYFDRALYQTVFDYRRQDELERIIKEIDFVCLTSASCVKAFKNMYKDIDNLKAKFVSIGPITTKTANNLGFKISATAKKYVSSSLIDTIIEEVNKENC